MKLTCFLLLLFMSIKVFSLPKASLTYLMKPTVLLSQGRYGQAAEQYHIQSINVLTKEHLFSSKGMWELAALLEGIAAISAQKNADPIAYEYWANSVKYYLIAGGSWEKSQHLIQIRYQQINSFLQASMAKTEVSISEDDSWLQELSIIELWDKKLNYFAFTRPALGLRQNTENQVMTTPSNSVINNHKTYSPGTALSFDSTFKSSAGFVIKPSPINNTTIKEVSLKKIPVKKEDDVIIGPSITNINDFNQEPVVPNNGGDTGINENEIIIVRPIPRGNIDYKRTEGTSSVRRRAFVPEMSEGKSYEN